MICARKTHLPELSYVGGRPHLSHILPLPSQHLGRHTRLYCLVTEAHVCEQLAQSRYLTVERLGIEPATFRSRVRRRNHYTTKPHLYMCYILDYTVTCYCYIILY